jgi:uncharacterized protein (TIGR00251 family)
MSLPVWMQETTDGVVLRLVLQPKASRSEIVGPHGEPPRLKIRIAAPPVDGEANEELMRFLKELLGIPASRIEILRGHASKQKDVHCRGVRANEVLRKAGETARLFSALTGGHRSSS